MYCLVYKDGEIIENIDDTVNPQTLWDGLFSKVYKNGALVKYISECIKGKKGVFIIPQSDGDFTREELQPYLDRYKDEYIVIGILGVLVSIAENTDLVYIYLPLDDDFIEQGMVKFFPKESLPPWDTKSKNLCWRGSCSGYDKNNVKETIRYRLVEHLYNRDDSKNVRLSHWWSYGKVIPQEYFDERLDYTEFLKYKIFFIVDGNCIASNHMWGFGTGSVPFIVSNAISWFSRYLIPYKNYIPVNYDLSDLNEKIDWVNNNDEKALEIAENAYKFAEEFFSSEFQKKYVKDEIDLKFRS